MILPSRSDFKKGIWIMDYLAYVLYLMDAFGMTEAEAATAADREFYGQGEE